MTNTKGQERDDLVKGKKVNVRSREKGKVGVD